MQTYIVAAFTKSPFRGNLAGVCILDRYVDRPQLQAIARELQQPETAFLLKTDLGWSIRWFSPHAEVDLCGHATLASAHVLWQEGLVQGDRAIAFTADTANLRATAGPEGMIWIDFPIIRGYEAVAPSELLAAINLAPQRTALHGVRWIFEYEQAEEVRDIRPDFYALRQTGVRSLICTAVSDQENYDIISRNFAPIVGNNEDQVTGTAHTCLAPHWQSRLGSELRCWQASERGGGMITNIQGDRVALGGHAVIELAGGWRSSGA